MRNFILGILAASMIFVCVGFIFLNMWEQELKEQETDKKDKS